MPLFTRCYCLRFYRSQKKMTYLNSQSPLSAKVNINPVKDLHPLRSVPKGITSTHGLEYSHTWETRYCTYHIPQREEVKIHENSRHVPSILRKYSYSNIPSFPNPTAYHSFTHSHSNPWALHKNSSSRWLQSLLPNLLCV